VYGTKQRQTEPQPGKIGVTAITAAVMMIIAASEPRDAWLQPWLRLPDTVVGVVGGVACKWAASSLFDKIVAPQTVRHEPITAFDYTRELRA
jgi:hypothetical protein